MIQASLQSLQRKAWQSELARAISDPAVLFEYLQLPLEHLPAARAACASFPLRVPPNYLQRIRPADMHDPLLRQVLPLGEELNNVSGFVDDPVGDLQSMPVPGLLHKYAGRALLVTTAACGVHCRYCFRRHFPYQEAHAAQGQWQAALDYLRSQPAVNEIILSGGDPLSLADHRLGELIEELAAIPHLQRLRLHTRLPVVVPLRVTDELCHSLSSSRLQASVVLHINHANEINTDLAEACARLKQSCSALLNQSVLLKGVNDSSDALAALSERLFASGVLPYYLHQLDPVEGSAHFAVSDDQARALHADLLTRLPGYLVPKLVRETAGEQSKLPL